METKNNQPASPQEFTAPDMIPEINEWHDFDQVEIEAQRRHLDDEDWAEFEAECAKMSNGGAK